MPWTWMAVFSSPMLPMAERLVAAARTSLTYPTAGARDGGEDVRGDESRVHDEQVAGADQHVSDEAENTGLLDLPQEHAGDADEGKDSHQDLQRVADSHIGGGDGGDVQVEVLGL